MVAWATEMDGIFDALQARLSEPGADSPVDGAMRVIVNSAANKIGELCSIAEPRARGAPNRRTLCARAMFKAEFKAAQAAVQKAVEKLETALAVDTNITVHGIDVKVDAGNEKLNLVIAMLHGKIDALGAHAKEKEVLRRRPCASCGASRRWPTSSRTSSTRDAAAASEALAAAPEEVRATAAAKFAEGAALQAQGKFDEALVAYPRGRREGPRDERRVVRHREGRVQERKPA